MFFMKCKARNGAVTPSMAMAKWEIIGGRKANYGYRTHNRLDMART
ncbi:hypothetical protein [Salipaludibacillus sp. CF4.18]